MRKIITSTIAGAASLLFANTAIATSVGEASISLRGGMTITLLEAGGGSSYVPPEDSTEPVGVSDEFEWQFDIDGEFVLDWLTLDPFATRPHVLSASLGLSTPDLGPLGAAWTANFGESIDLPSSSIADLVNSIDSAGVASYLGPFLPFFPDLSGINLNDLLGATEPVSISFAKTLVISNMEYAGLLTTLDFEGESFSGIPLSYNVQFRISDVPPPALVPLPAALPLALGGFALLGGLGMRRRCRIMRSV